MGNHSIQFLAEGITLIASAKTWIEGDAIQQLETSAKLEGMLQVAGMPDLHPGRGYPVGAAFFSQDVFYPALIGNDIGCGMALWQSTLDRSKFSAEKLEKRIGNIDHPLDEDWQETVAGFGLPASGFERSLGTIGGGNHFAELQAVESVYAKDIFDALGLQQKRLLLLVHSGSRGLGQQILAAHVTRFGHRGLADATDEAEAYLAAHDLALQYAQVNRTLIAQRIFSHLHCEGRVLLDAHHNSLSRTSIGTRNGWLHRKGASPANGGLAVIPGSRGDHSYLVETIPDERSLYSIAHGAGRKWMRAECKGRLSKRYSPEQLERTLFGSHVVCADKQLMYEEAPEAYKAVSSVIDALQEAGLIRVVARLKPVLTYKTRGEDKE